MTKVVPPLEPKHVAEKALIRLAYRFLDRGDLDSAERIVSDLKLLRDIVDPPFPLS